MRAPRIALGLLQLLAAALALPAPPAASAAAHGRGHPSPPPAYSGVLASCTPADFGPVPGTLSAEARAMLARHSGPPPDTDNSPAGIAAQRERLDAAGRALSDQYKAAYVEAFEEVDLGGVRAARATPRAGVAANGSAVPPAAAAPRDVRGAIMHLHGGAYTVGDPRVQVQSYAPLAAATGLDAYAPVYRLAPEHPFPAALDDAVAAYKALLKRHPAERIVLSGGSAGAHLAAALLLRLAADKLPQPRVAVLFSPWSLMELGDADTHFTLRCADPALNFNALNASAHHYKGKAPNFDSPYLSPGKADWGAAAAASRAAGFALPPVLVFAGTREMLLGDAAALTDAMRRGGVSAGLRVYSGMVHSFPTGSPPPSPGPMLLPEAERAVRESAEFVRRHLPAAQAAESCRS